MFIHNPIITYLLTTCQLICLYVNCYLIFAGERVEKIVATVFVVEQKYLGAGHVGIHRLVEMKFGVVFVRVGRYKIPNVLRSQYLELEFDFVVAGDR